MQIVEIIEHKKIGQELSEEEIKYCVEKYVSGEIKDSQMSALLMAIVLNGMTDSETFILTKYFIDSGKTIKFSNIKGTIVDKHSTGGVGDKTTLIICPIVAACGVSVVKMSGHGLGATGGTADKLEAIPNIKIELSEAQIVKQVKENNLVFVTQTKNIALADKKIYALRNETGTINSIPLIASSIMSKKMACGSDAIVLDVKIGRGAFMKNIEDARKLATLMNKIAKHNNKQVVSLITNMDIPLGSSIGNSLEIEEALEILQNKKKNNLSELCIELSSYMVSLGLNVEYDEAKQMVLEKLSNGEAYQKFIETIQRQGGEIDKMEKAKYVYSVKSTINGYVTDINALELANYCLSLGSGKVEKEDIIDYSVGIVLEKGINDYVSTNDVLLNIHSNKEITSFDDILLAFEITSKKKEINPLIYEIVK